MTSTFIDRFDRVDGPIGSAYLVPCGAVTIFDEAVLPVDVTNAVSGFSPRLPGITLQKAQVLYNQEQLDGPDYVVRGVLSRDPETLNITLTSDPSFTLLVRMTKDPLLVDLGVAEDPFCYNQGYGLRFTCPRDGTAPILKIVKYLTKALPPGYLPPTSLEPDGSVILASYTLTAAELNLDPVYTGTGLLPYQGFVQEVRLRVRRADNEVVLEAYVNERNMVTPAVTYTDKRDPLWGARGLPGFEFLSAAKATQPVGSSPFHRASVPLMRCHLFEAQTIKDFRRAVQVAPANFYTYDRVIDRCIQLVEKDGDARYTATGSGATKRAVYLGFIIEAEKDIIRREGYYHWLQRNANVYLRDGIDTYEMPEDCGMIEMVRPGNFTQVPLQEATLHEFHMRLAGVIQSGGKPTIYVMAEESVNNRKTIKVFPKPLISQIQVSPTEAPYLVVEYYARLLYPSETDVQIPYVPQEHVDVLIYGAAAHALMMDTDVQNSEMFRMSYERKLADLRRDNNRKGYSRRTVMRSAADTFKPGIRSRVPLLRAAQLETFLLG